MSDLIKLLGLKATQDPARLKMEIRSAAVEHEQAHVDKNIAKKLTHAKRRVKKERKLFNDNNTLKTIVYVYKMNDLSHPQTWFKVDVNAQEKRMSGCAVISKGICVVVVEGEHDEDDDSEKSQNKCLLVWQGSVSKPSFHMFLVHSCRIKNAAHKEKEPEFERRKPESKVNVSPSSSAQSKKHDDKTKREAKGKSPVKSLTGYRILSAEFEYFFDNSINKDNDAGTLILAVRQLSPNSTNTFSTVGPSNAATSLTHRKSSCIDTSQLPDDPNMPKLEDITYSDDEDDVGAEADFNNLETSIIVSPIPITRVHKDYHMTQIIGDLSSATQTRSMTRVARDQGGLSQINNNDFHTCMFACFLSQEEPKRVLVDLPHGKRAIDGNLANTLRDTEKPLLKDPDGEDVDVHTFRSMIVKRIFRYLKGKLHLGLWYPKDLPFDLVAYLDSDYAGSSLDRKSTTGGCQFLGCRLISRQCKKQIVVATSST
nr:hypothetical protein [Tanacetum cinerariifolium]